MNLSEYLIQNSHCPFCKSPVPATFRDFRTDSIPYRLVKDCVILQVTQALYRNVEINLVDNTCKIEFKQHQNPLPLIHHLNAKKIRVIKDCACPQEFRSISSALVFNDNATLAPVSHDNVTCKILSFQITNNHKHSKTTVIDTTIETPYSLLKVSSYQEFPMFNWEKLKPEQILTKIKTLSIFS